MKMYSRGSDRLRFDPGRRFHHQQEKVFILAGIEQQTGVNLVAGQGVAQDKVLIAGGLFVLDLDLGGVLPGVFDLHFVAGAGQPGDGQAAGQLHVQAEGIGRRLAFMQIGVLNPLVGIRRALRRLRGIARPHHRGINELIDIVLGLEELHVVEFHLDFVARQDVGHVHLEDIGPLLLQERGGFARLFGRLVGFPGLLPLHDLGLDDPLADGHAHGVHRRPGGAREDVNGLQGLFAGVLIDLGDLDFRHQAGDLHVGPAALQRHDVFARFVADHHKIRGQGLIRRFAGFSQRPRA